jgi:quercetin dioxygenase-like cupin family protein
MDRIKISLPLAFIAFFLVTFACGIAIAESSSKIISYARMYADDSGQTHFSDETINLEDVPDVPDFKVTPFTQASSVGFFHAAATLDTDWHPAPRRQWIFILSGTIEVEVQDGEVRQFPSGSILFVEDTSGKGHKTRVVGEEAALAAWVPVGTNYRSNISLVRM